MASSVSTKEKIYNESFPYEKLPNSNYLRILKLDPGKGINDELLGTLETHPRKKSPPYRALSYVWGPNERTKAMCCNKEQFLITDNLDAAMRRLRSSNHPIHLWIDQICINQNDIEERSSQVSFMRDIYSGAECVEAWLGPATLEQAGHAAMLMTSIATLPDIPIPTNSALTFPSDEKLQKLKLPTRSSPSWSSLETMLRLPYFKRVWIIQEIVVASTYRLLWGSMEISKEQFDLFRANAIFLGTGEPDGREDCPRLSVSNGYAAFGAMKGKNRDLFELATITLSYQATDPRDMIFALIGLADGIDYGMVPDYNKEEGEVFADFTSKVISATKSLEILHYPVISDPSNAKHPLWAPRWQWHSDMLSLDFTEHDFRASGELEARQGVSTDTNVMSLKGLEVDVVKETADRPVTTIKEAAESSNLIIKYQDLCTERYCLDIIRPFLLTLIGGRERSDTLQHKLQPIKDDKYLDDFVAYAFSRFTTVLEKDMELSRQLLLLMRRAVDSSNSSTKGSPSLKGTETFKWLKMVFGKIYLNDTEAISSNLEMMKRISCLGVERTLSFHRLMLRSARGRRFFVTEKGYHPGPPNA
ncbi:hypothetical protein F53441_10722 [Fusarium austroafricanum]|uniref:Heterokaryon incompatibility domain-containing protein n=1 Tax=Fusarium austroafricanum TaxID=2364996 RepID=A0A8H4K929_9HYPO|nr:hypothetical protein F53441_10722 [Fusarium austroafricanum]